MIGSAGEPGHPGKAGHGSHGGAGGIGGAGGTGGSPGGAGGPGGPGGVGGAGARTLEWARAWQYLIGYVFVVIISGLSAWLFTWHVTHQLNNRDRISCDQRTALIKDVMHLQTATISDRVQHHAQPTTLVQLQNDLENLRLKLARGC